MSDDDKKKPTTMGDLVGGITEMLLANRKRWAAEAAQKRGVQLDPAKMTDAEFEHWEAVSSADEIGEERRKATDAAAKAQVALAGSLRWLLPEEFSWVDPHAPDPLYERVAGARTALAAARGAADALARGDVKRVLLVGPAGAGKTTLAALIPQVMAARWAKDEHAQALARIDARPIDEIVRERAAARKKYEAEEAARQPGDPIQLILRRRPRDFSGPPASSGLSNVLAKVTVSGAISAHWTTAYELFRLAKKPIGFKESDPLQEAREARILVLDDIGGEPTQANIAPVEDVIRERHDAQRITIATSGMFDAEADPGDLDKLLAPLSAKYGAAVVRRLAEKGRAIVIVVGTQGIKRAA